MKKNKSELEKFRIRWNRWLGQMTRCDRDNWITLLDCNWSGWANKVLERGDSQHPRLYVGSSKSSVHYVYEAAIAVATMEELKQLDNIYCQEVLQGG